MQILQWVARGVETVDREDMAQEAVLNTIVAIANNQVDMQRFDPWFYTVVRNVARDWHRRYGRDIQLQEAHEPEDARVNAELERLLAGRDLQALLEGTPSLQPHERTVLALTYGYDLSSREIADILGARSASVVRTWHARALDKLRTHLRRA
jgi:RNA polymerase sigma factor (sigma-70 family)